MEDSARLDPGRTILQAVRLTVHGEIALLHQLIAASSKTLESELVLRILLTFLPEKTEPALYIDLLRDVAHGSWAHVPLQPTLPETNLSNDETVHRSGVDADLSDNEVRKKVQKLHLLPLKNAKYSVETSLDPLSQFLLLRARRIDLETGSLVLVYQLIEPFWQHSVHIKTWAVGTLLPLYRLNYEQPPFDEPFPFLESFEDSAGSSAIASLLFEITKRRRDEGGLTLGQGLRAVIGPWIYGENERSNRNSVRGDNSAEPVSLQSPKASQVIDSISKPSNGWVHVNRWLLNQSLQDFSQIAETLISWDGPRDIDYGDWSPENLGVEAQVLKTHTDWYAQTSLALIYAAQDSSKALLERSFEVLKKTTRLLDVSIPTDLTIEMANQLGMLPLDYLKTLSPAHLRYDSLLQTQNPFTSPMASSAYLLYFLLLSGKILESLNCRLACSELAKLCFFSHETEQIGQLRKILLSVQEFWNDQTKSRTHRDQILWLRNWGPAEKVIEQQPSDHLSGLFSRITYVDLEVEILKAFLHAAYYDLAIQIYCDNSHPAIPSRKLEEVILGEALVCYDGASNGNRTRGGVRKASEIINAFRQYFPESEGFREILALFSATHTMSFYTLSLHHGVPFQPVNIRAHKDPIRLIEKILQQNTHSYTKLDDLLDIGRDLVLAGLTKASSDIFVSKSTESPHEEQLVNMKRRVIAMAIEAGLAEGDFGTAYSYVVNRLSSPSFATVDTPVETNSLSVDDISWRAAYRAGSYQSTNSLGNSQLRHLEQRMELLAQALLLAPSSALAEVLTAWRQCEKDMNTLIAREAEEEVRWDDKGDRKLPGSYSSDPTPSMPRSYRPPRGAQNEEGPMGLFEVARGAAAALGRNAFPLKSSRLLRSAAEPSTMQPNHPLDLTTKVGKSEDKNELMTQAQSEARVRKRDVVSSMVTGGLASGIGWVIGAPPSRNA